VEADHAAHERAAVRLDEAAALGEAAPRLVAAAVALGRAVTEHRAHAERLARVGQHVERALDERRRLVVIDEGRRAREQRLAT
jgi:hypothetical protein